MAAERKSLTLEDREGISRGLAKGLPNKDISQSINRDESVVSREVKRHGGRAGYRAWKADAAARKSRNRPKERKIDADRGLHRRVMSDLLHGWSPEQIAGRLRHENYRGETDMSISHEAVYTWIYAQPKGERARAGIILRTGREQRKPRGRKKSKGAKIVGKSLTWDQGTEMAQHAALTLDADLPAYFARAHSPWERGTNENTNGLIREYLPKGTELPSDMSYLQAVANSLNDRPRAILGFRTPNEVFGELRLQESVSPPA